MDPKFYAGKFVRYRATKMFAVGDGTLIINRGDEVEFDGLDLRIGESTVEQPQLRSAVRAGWLVPINRK